MKNKITKMHKLKVVLIIIIPICFLFACNSETNTEQIYLYLEKNWEFRQLDSGEWKKAFVPGNVINDLFTDTLIGNPLHRLNYEQAQWVSSKNWEYKNSFDVDFKTYKKGNILLVFEGIDTYSEVYLNDSMILKTDNMFEKYSVECKKYLKIGENELYIKFLMSDKNYSEYGDSLNIPFRKKAVDFGYCIGPKLVSGGIWKPVYFVAYNKFIIEKAEIIQNEINDSIAKLSAYFVINSSESYSTKLTTIISDSIQISENYELTKGINYIEQEIAIENPELWYPTGMGNAHLYNFKFTFKSKNQIIETKEISIGLKTITVEKDTSNNFNKITINGLPFFIKGMNYIFHHDFNSSLLDISTEKLIEYAKVSNLNTLKISGSGIYESDEFYNYCDKAGIIVIQEIPLNYSEINFAENFVTDFTNELTQNLNRLKNHPSLCFLSFNHPEKNGNILKTDSLINNFLTNQNYSIKYISNIGNNYSENIYPFENYSSSCSFFTEFGLSSVMCLTNLQTFTVPSDVNFESLVMNEIYYQKQNVEFLKQLLTDNYFISTVFENNIYITQIIQAEKIKNEIETLRVNNEIITGNIIQNLNESCPAVSASGIDYFGDWKAVQYVVKQAFANVSIAVKEQNGQVNVYVTSYNNLDLDCEINCRVADLYGKSTWKESKDFTLSANSTKKYFSFSKWKITKGKALNGLVFRIKIVKDNETIAETYYYFTEIKKLALQCPNITTDVLKTDIGYVLEFKTDFFAKNIYVTSLIEGHFEENFFDLLPGESKFVKFATDFEIADLTTNFKIFTLHNTFENGETTVEVK